MMILTRATTIRTYFQRGSLPRRLDEGDDATTHWLLPHTSMQVNLFMESGGGGAGSASAAPAAAAGFGDE